MEHLLDLKTYNYNSFNLIYLKQCTFHFYMYEIKHNYFPSSDFNLHAFCSTLKCFFQIYLLAIILTHFARKQFEIYNILIFKCDACFFFISIFSLSQWSYLLRRLLSSGICTSLFSSCLSN